MSLNKVVSLEEHCCLADFGIRFNTLTFGTCASPGVGGDGETDDVGDAGNGAGGLGGLPDPGHLAVTGP